MFAINEQCCYQNVFLPHNDSSVKIIYLVTSFTKKMHKQTPRSSEMLLLSGKNNPNVQNYFSTHAKTLNLFIYVLSNKYNFYFGNMIF